MDFPSAEDTRKVVSQKLQFLADIENPAAIPIARGKDLLVYFESTCESLAELECNMKQAKADIEKDFQRKYDALQDTIVLLHEQQKRKEQDLKAEAASLQKAWIAIEELRRSLCAERLKFVDEKNASK
ncbi:hypothetical protein PG995_003121 [Apiospora arundinis]